MRRFFFFFLSTTECNVFVFEMDCMSVDIQFFFIFHSKHKYSLLEYYSAEKKKREKSERAKWNKKNVSCIY